MRDDVEPAPGGPGAGGGPGDRGAAARQAMMRVLSRATPAEIPAALAALSPLPASTELRKPEVGLVMLRGRIGGDGAAFNVGEATVTRAAVRLASGEVGFSYLLGRVPEAARAAALIDAIWQTAEGRPRIEQLVLAPLAAAAEQRRCEAAARIAATRVDFFTMVRGEDL